jgi:hypothetical protein
MTEKNLANPVKMVAANATCSVNQLEIPAAPRRSGGGKSSKTDFRCPGAGFSKWELKARTRGASVAASGVTDAPIPIQWEPDASWTQPVLPVQAAPAQTNPQLIAQTFQFSAEGHQAFGRLSPNYQSR